MNITFFSKNKKTAIAHVKKLNREYSDKQYLISTLRLSKRQIKHTKGLKTWIVDKVKHKKPKFKVGDRVYSYQNKNYPARINRVSKASDSDPLDVHKYRLTLKHGSSKWINENSLHRRKPLNW